MWDSTTLQCKRTLEGHEDNVRVLTVGSRHVFSGSWDKTIRVWDIDTLECIKVRRPCGTPVLALGVKLCLVKPLFLPGQTFLVSVRSCSASTP